jgi:hypothetical protein
MPTVFTMCKTFHARFVSAILASDPTAKARKEANVERAKLVEELFRYTLREWMNEHTGIDDIYDELLWDWVTAGSGVLKAGWEKKFERYEKVINDIIPENRMELDEAGNLTAVPRARTEQRIATVTEEIFNGPTARVVNLEDIVVIGGKGDPQRADYVIESTMMTSSELYSLADQKIFRKSAVEETIDSGNDQRTDDVNGNIKQDRARQAGNQEINRAYEYQRYEVLECYLSADIDGSGIHAQIVVWVHKDTRALLRASYLRRMSPSGMRPYFKIDFHKRKDAEWGVGLPELLNTLAKEVDAIHNMRIDVGILQSMPFGVYRPIASMREEQYEIVPGTLLPVENPQTDVAFPNIGNKVSFGFQEEAALMNQVERLTSVSDLSLGIQSGNQGAARTARGATILSNEANTNLDIFLKRLNRGLKQFYKFLFAKLQQRLPEGFDFRLLGDDGNQYWATVERPEEIAGQYDFEIESSTANSNKQVQVEQADIAFQLSQNPILLQLGIVSTANLFNAAKETLRVRGVKEFTKYLTKPQDVVRQFSPEEIGNRLLSGIDVPLDPTQDLDGFVTWVSEIMKSDETVGQFGPSEVATLVLKAQEAQALSQAVQQAAAQQANIQQQQQNAQQANLGQTFGETVQANPNTGQTTGGVDGNQTG